jgi:hypothetical protein
LDLRAERLLAEVQPSSGPREVQFLREHLERAQLAQLHIHKNAL